MIKKLLRERLLIEGTYSYGCVMLDFDIPIKVWDEVQKRVKEEDLYKGDADDYYKYGRETEPHCTLLYGLLPDIDDKDIERIVTKFKPVEISLSKISVFENDDYDVLKFELSDKTLTKYNKELSELPNENEYPDYKAHITIAYVKKGKITKEMKSPLETKIDIVGNHITYSKADDTKKEFKLN